MSDKPLASVSLDVDDLWTYLRTHGDPGWTERPSYLTTFVPIALGLLDELALRITFFVVGADGARRENAAALGELSAAGHEIGNHSFDHEPWLHRYDQGQLEQELDRSEAAIHLATGQRPVGFRGPGYSWSPLLLDLLSRRGYLYDASTLPTYLGPLARAYYFRTTHLTKEEAATRSHLFGSFADGLRPSRAYWWRLAEGRKLLEIPVTTFPGFKTPFHLSYLLYLARYSDRLALTYLRAAATACRLTGNSLSFLLHPLDLLDRTHAPHLAFFPGMDLDHGRKRALFVAALEVLREQFTLVPMGVHAAALAAFDGLPTRQPGTYRPLSRPASVG
jgi:peptidoglycan/xylan/chitin deacetylase (PgdA/CDA1 family)